MPTIVKSGSKLTVGTMDHEGGSVAKKIFSLNEHKGARVRVHISINDEYSIEIEPRQKLLICELELPEREYIRTKKIVDGETVIESIEKGLKLEEVSITEYFKKEVKKKI